MTEPLASQLLDWYDKQGRQDLPWRQNITPYKVWLSEVMLQQTQVTTVLPYFRRFLEFFPTVDHLASANLDDVMWLWAGLGYYTRARNLHRTAQIVSFDYDGFFPDTADELEKLPGIGRSTASAIAAIAFKQRAAILDGNVKRVLSRLYGIDGTLDNNNVKKQLWYYAEQLVPADRPDDYTQAMMDLGATLCTKKKPLCYECPLKGHCYAYHHNMTERIPVKKPSKAKPVQYRYFFMIMERHFNVLFERLPPTGVWGGLWCLPYCGYNEQWQKLLEKRYNLTIKNWRALKHFKHTFSHYELYGYPIIVEAENVLQNSEVADNSSLIWYDMINNTPAIGLPKPIQTLIQRMRSL